MNLRIVIGLASLIGSGCSFGPPNLAPILQDPGSIPASTTIVSASYETAQSYTEKPPYPEAYDDGLMQFTSYKFSIAAATGYQHLLVVPYFHDLIFNPGLGIGLKFDGFYGLMAFDFFILERGEFRSHSPHFGGQAGVRLSRYAVLTYDYFHLSFMDLHPTAYGWESLHETETSASRISLAMGKWFYVIPGLIYAHANHKLGWTLNLSVGLGGRDSRPTGPGSNSN
jgi:hypothetical protein